MQKLQEKEKREAREVNHISDFSHCIQEIVNFILAANLYMPSQRYVTISLDIKKRKLHDDSSYSFKIYHLFFFSAIQLPEQIVTLKRPAKLFLRYQNCITARRLVLAGSRKSTF